MKKILLAAIQFILVAIWETLSFIYSKAAAWSRKNPAQAKAGACVIVLHLGLLIFFASKLKPPTVIRTRNRVVVSTIQLHPRKPAPIAASKPKPQPAPPATPKPKPKPKAISEKKNAKPVDKKSQARQQEFLKKALASLNKIEDTDPHDEKFSLPPLSTIGSLQTEISDIPDTDPLNPQEANYCEELVAQLKLKMRLPDFGQVRVELTVDREGNITKVKVLSSQSEANRAYVEAIMPQLTLPPFGKNFGGEKKHRFLLALDNDV